MSSCPSGEKLAHKVQPRKCEEMHGPSIPGVREENETSAWQKMGEGPQTRSKRKGQSLNPWFSPKQPSGRTREYGWGRKFYEDEGSGGRCTNLHFRKKKRSMNTLPQNKTPNGGFQFDLCFCGTCWGSPSGNDRYK